MHSHNTFKTVLILDRGDSLELMKSRYFPIIKRSFILEFFMLIHQVINKNECIKNVKLIKMNKNLNENQYNLKYLKNKYNSLYILVKH